MAQDPDQDLYLDDETPLEDQAAQDERAPAAGGGETAKEPETVSAKEFKALQKQLETERKNRQTADETARYWQSKSTQGAPAPAAEPAKPAAKAEDFLEAITSGDTSRIQGVLDQLGFVKREDVARELNAARSTARTEALLEKEYPTITDNRSTMFKTTARIFQELSNEEPALKTSPKTTLLAARLAEAELLRKGIDPRAGEDAVDEPEEETDDEERPTPRARETEAARVRRVQAVAGARRTPSSNRSREGSDDLTPMQKDLIQKFRDAGAESLTEETFRKRAQAGIRMGGAPGRHK